jgi:lysophospholipase L1-like esterase
MKNIRRFFTSPRHSAGFVFLLVVVITWSFWPLQVSSAAIPHVNYTDLGDSLAFGLFAPLGQGYVTLYAGNLQSDLSLPVILSPLGVPGWTSGDLLSALRGNWLFRISVFFSDVVTWNIGGNDLSAARSKYKAKTCGGSDNQQCLRDAVQAFKSNWDGIITEILSLRRLRPTLLRTMDIYNPFVNEDQAADTWSADLGNDFQVINPYLNEVNSYIAATTAPRHIAYAPVHLWFNGSAGTVDPGGLGLLAFDHFHPNAAGHALVAQLLRGLAYVPIIP